MGVPTARSTVSVKGFTQLQRAFALADPALKKRLRGTLSDAALPVRSDAEGMAVSSIRNVGVEWSRMRVGVTTRAVYVAPKHRGAKTGKQKRPNLADLLLARSMLPALDRNEAGTTAAVERMLDGLAGDWERV